MEEVTDPEVAELKEELKTKPQEGEVLQVKTPITCGKSEHYFRLTRNEMGPAAECTRCPIGYPLPIGSEVKDGHIYIHGSFVI